MFWLLKYEMVFKWFRIFLFVGRTFFVYMVGMLFRSFDVTRKIMELEMSESKNGFVLWGREH